METAGLPLNNAVQWNIYNHDILSYYLNSKSKNLFESHEAVF